MKVRELIMKTAVFCRPNLAAVAVLTRDCVALPVVSDGHGGFTARLKCPSATTRSGI